MLTPRKHIFGGMNMHHEVIGNIYENSDLLKGE